MRAWHSDIEAGTAIVEVSNESRRDLEENVTFQWADWSYQSRTVRGSLTGLIPGNTGKPLTDLLHPNESSFSGVAMSLKNAFSDDSYRIVSDSSGNFDFGLIPEGTYILTIAGGMKSVAGIASETLLVIDVAKKRSRDFLRLRLKDNGCYRAEFALDEAATGSPKPS